MASIDHLTYESKENVEEPEGHGPGQAYGNIAWSRGLLSSAPVLMPQLSTLHHSNPVPRACSLAGVGVGLPSLDFGACPVAHVQPYPAHAMAKEALQIHAYEFSSRVIGEKATNRLSAASAIAKAMSLGAGWASRVTSARP